MRKLIATLAIIVLILFAAVVFVYFRPAKPLDRPHIILIVIDTLRADHVGCYGYPRPTTPIIDKLAAQGTLFNKVYPSSSWTLPSMVSIFTGLWPQRHGVVEGMQTLGVLIYQHQLGEAHRTLAERLSDAGYETYGYSTNIHITRHTGFAQGFTAFREAATGNAEQVEELLAQDLEKLRQRDRKGKPYFLYLHFFDPHTPYMAREPYIKAVAPELNTRALVAANPMQGDLMSGFPPGHFIENPEQLQALIDVYDSEIAAVDAAIGRILARLPGADRGVVMILSDHGEAFYEHQTMLHGFDIHEETLRVPLIIRERQDRPSSPGAAGRRVENPVSLVDVAPTLLRYAGVAHGDLPGLDLMGEIPADRVFPIHLRRGSVRMHGALIWPLKTIVEEKTGRTLLFDLEKDPGERKNLLPARDIPVALKEATERAGKIEPDIEAVLVRNTFGGDRERLRSLGYLGDGRSALPGEKPEATPKPVPWFVELGICPLLEKIVSQCGKGETPVGKVCVERELDALKEKTCSKASSFNYRKKCEFMRLASTQRRCRENIHQGQK